jgi:hypothetical protein
MSLEPPCRQVGRVNDVPGGSQVVRESEEAWRLALCMVKEKDLGHRS